MAIVVSSRLSRKDKNELNKVKELVEGCSNLFAGHEPEVVGAALADLLAMLLAGYMGPGVDEVREELLRGHIEAVRNMVKVNEALIMDGLVDDTNPN